MDINTILANASLLWTPGTFAILSTLAVLFLWIAVAPSRAQKAQEGRLDRYRHDLIEEEALQRSFWTRAIAPVIRNFFRLLSKLSPRHNIDKLRATIMHAGEPAKLTPADSSELNSTRQVN